MTALAHFSLAQIFKPIDPCAFEALVLERDQKASIMRDVSTALEGDPHAVLDFFLTGNGSERWTGLSAGTLFTLAPALAVLDASMWERALELTDIMATMPADRREKWREQIDKRDCPEFTAANVAATLGGLLADRPQFLAERVDGVFRALSGEHVTNRPQGFSKLMILSGVRNFYGGRGSGQIEHINDLRCVLAKITGREAPPPRSTRRVVISIYECGMTGEWLELDGGEVRIRCYKKGTAHLEIHPDLAWKLNAILASIHPRAIPPQYRQRPKRRAKNVTLIRDLLPGPVLAALCDMEIDSRSRADGAWMVAHHYSSDPSSVICERVTQVLTSLGGVERGDAYAFAYPPRAVIATLLGSGCVPDEKSHQYYPTPDSLAERLVEFSGIGSSDKRRIEVLEPSAGTGALANAIEELARVYVSCIEVDPLRCEVLRALGYTVEQADFLDVRPTGSDAVVMNPPWNAGRWRAHLEHAAELAPRVAAILPASAAKVRGLLPGWSLTWSEVIERPFPGVSVDCVMLLAVRG